MRFHTDRRYQIPLSPPELWGAIAEVDDFRGWWPWLRRFEGERLAMGERWQCTVQPPLPYIVRFEVALDEVLEARSVGATISGDVVGEARLDITERSDGCEARLVSSLEPGHLLLRAMARFAAPVVRHGHDWVIDSGARQFLDHLSEPRRDRGVA